MTALAWEERRFEAGISHGVFYPEERTWGVPWNGIVSLAEGFVGAERSVSHLEGLKYLETVGGRNYQATLTAFSAPKEFGPYNGARSLIPGFVLDKQPRRRFHLSYRTEMDEGYKIHLVYNALATPQGRSYRSIGLESASLLTWKIDATPVPIDGFRPTAHLIVDSTRTGPNLLQALHDRLYGTDAQDASFPAPAEMVWAFLNWVG